MLPTILFVGGGTGGHIFPSFAIWERLLERAANVNCRAHFVVSNRALDAQIMNKRKQEFTALSMQPLALRRPWTWFGFIDAWQHSVAQCRQLFRELNVAAMVATGGFVAAPVIWSAGRDSKLPVAMLNLDAVPGKANRFLARQGADLFTVYPVPQWRDAKRIGLPLPRAAMGPADAAAARVQLALDPDRDVLLVTGGSQGAESINRLMIALMKLTSVRQALAGWQVLHLAGPMAATAPIMDELRTAYAGANVRARVETFCNAMGLAWGSASLAIARAGAGTVAEVWANATPTIFLPYPYHKDQHQRRNAEPLVEAGAAVMFRDLVDPDANARQLAGPFVQLFRNTAQRQHMTERLRQTQPGDGAEVVARWIMQYLK